MDKVVSPENFHIESICEGQSPVKQQRLQGSDRKSSQSPTSSRDFDVSYHFQDSLRNTTGKTCRTPKWCTCFMTFSADRSLFKVQQQLHRELEAEATSHASQTMLKTPILVGAVWKQAHMHGSQLPGLVVCADVEFHLGAFGEVAPQMARVGCMEADCCCAALITSRLV